MFWNNKKADNPQNSKILLGMVMLNDEQSFDVTGFVDDFKKFFGHSIKKPTGNNNSFAFSIGGETAAIAHMPFPIPSGDIEGTAQYSYNWQTALEDTKNHKSHVIVSIIRGGKHQVQRFKLFTQVICSLLRTTNSLGVYMGNQSLLIPKDDYLKEADLMDDDYLPLNLWIYFGFRVTDKGNSGYTYGLKEFNKKELEVVHSSNSVENIRVFLLNIAHYVLEYDVTFKDGQTVGGSEEEKIVISLSKRAICRGGYI